MFIIMNMIRHSANNGFSVGDTQIRSYRRTNTKFGKCRIESHACLWQRWKNSKTLKYTSSLGKGRGRCLIRTIQTCTVKFRNFHDSSIQFWSSTLDLSISAIFTKSRPKFIKILMKPTNFAYVLVLVSSNAFMNLKTHTHNSEHVPNIWCEILLTFWV